MAARRDQLAKFVMPKLRYLQSLNRRTGLAPPSNDNPELFPFAINEIPVKYVTAIVVFTVVVCTYALWKYAGVRWSWLFAPTVGVAKIIKETPEDDQDDMFVETVGDGIAPKTNKTTIDKKATSAGFPTPRQTKLSAKRLGTVTTRNPCLLSDPSQEPKTEVTSTFLSPSTEALSDLSNGSIDAKHNEKDSASVELALTKSEAQSRNSDDLVMNLKTLEALPRFKNINTYLYGKHVGNKTKVSETCGTSVSESLPEGSREPCAAKEKKKKVKNVVMKEVEEKTYTDSDSRPSELSWNGLETKSSSSKINICKSLLKSKSDAPCNSSTKTKNKEASSVYTRRSAKLISNKAETRPICSKSNIPTTSLESTSGDFCSVSKEKKASNSSTSRYTKLTSKKADTQPNCSKTNISSTLLESTPQAPHTIQKKKKKKVSFSSSTSSVRSTMLTSIRPETEPICSKKNTPKASLEQTSLAPSGISKKMESSSTPTRRSTKLTTKILETRPICSKTNISNASSEPISDYPCAHSKKKAFSSFTPRFTKLTSKKSDTRPNSNQKDIPKTLGSTSLAPSAFSKKSGASNSSTSRSAKLTSKGSETSQDFSQTSLIVPHPCPERATNVAATHGRPSSECSSHKTTGRCPSLSRRSTALACTRTVTAQHSSPTHPSVSPTSHARSRRGPDSPSNPSSPASSGHTTIAQGSPPTQPRPTPTLTATSCQDHGVPTDASTRKGSPRKSLTRLSRKNSFRLGTGSSSNITSDAAIVDLEMLQDLQLLNEDLTKSSRCNSPTRNAPFRWNKPLRKHPLKLESRVLKRLRKYNNDILISNNKKLQLEDVSTMDDYCRVDFSGYSCPEEEVDSEKELDTDKSLTIASMEAVSRKPRNEVVAKTRFGDDIRSQDDVSEEAVTEPRRSKPDVTCPDVTQPGMIRSGPKDTNITAPEVTFIDPTSLQNELATQQINTGPKQTRSHVEDTQELTQTISENYESKSNTNANFIFIDFSFKESEEDVPEDGWRCDLARTTASPDLTALGPVNEDSVTLRPVEMSNARPQARSLDAYILAKPPISTYLRASPSLQCDAVATRMTSATHSTEDDVLSVPDPSGLDQLRISPRLQCSSLPAVISPSSTKTAKRKSVSALLRKHYTSATTQATMPAPRNPNITHDDTVEKIDVPYRDDTAKPALVASTLGSTSMREPLSEIISPLRTDRAALSRRAKSVPSRTQVLPTKAALLASMTKATARSEMPSLSTSVLPTRKRWSEIEMSDSLSVGRSIAFDVDFSSDCTQRSRSTKETRNKSKQGTIEEVLSDDVPLVSLQYNVKRNTKSTSLTRMNSLINDLEPKNATKSDQTSEEATENPGMVQQERSTLPTKSLTLETPNQKKVISVMVPSTEPVEPLSVDVAVGLPTPPSPKSGNTLRRARKSQRSSLLESAVSDLSESLPKPAINVNVLTAMSEVASEKPCKELCQSCCNESVNVCQLEDKEAENFKLVDLPNLPAPKRLGAKVAGRNMSKATPRLRISKPVTEEEDYVLQETATRKISYKNLQNDQNTFLKTPPGSKMEHNSVQKIPTANISKLDAMIAIRNKYKATPILKKSIPVHVEQEKVLNNNKVTSKSDQDQVSVVKILKGSDISKQVPDNEGCTARTRSASTGKTTPKIEIPEKNLHDKQDTDFKTHQGSAIPKRDANKGQDSGLKRLQDSRISNRYFKSNQGGSSLSPQVLYFASQTLDRNVLKLNGKLNNVSKQVSNIGDCMVNESPSVMKSNQSFTNSHIKRLPHIYKDSVLKSPCSEKTSNKCKAITEYMAENSLEPYNSKQAQNYDLTSSILELPQQVLDIARANFVEAVHLQNTTNIFPFHAGDSASLPHRKYFVNVNCKRKTYFRLASGPKKCLPRKGVPGIEKRPAKKVAVVKSGGKVVDILVEEVVESPRHVKPSSQSSLYRVGGGETRVQMGKAEAASESLLTGRSSWLSKSQLNWLARRNKAR